MSETFCKRILKLDKFVTVFPAPTTTPYTHDYCYATLQEPVKSAEKTGLRNLSNVKIITPNMSQTRAVKSL